MVQNIVKNITSFVTILDNECGLYKFGNLKVSDGKFFLNYIFQNKLQNKIILQLYRIIQGLHYLLLIFNCPILLLLQIMIQAISFQIYLKIF